MNLQDKIYEDLNAVTKVCKDQDAIVHYSEYGDIKKFKYKDVKRISDIFYENLKYLKKKSICFGLLMNHNIFIPSIIFCLKQLKCGFCFLNADIVEYDTIDKLGIQYIIVNNIQCYIQHTKLFFSIRITDEVYDIYIAGRKYSIYENIDFIVQTSGTTNIQKNVKVEHHCIASNIVCLRNRLQITSKDIIYFGTSLTFDPAIIELYLALTTGATLFIVSNKVRQNPIAFYKALFENESVKVTVLQMCPSMFMQWNMQNIENILQNSSLRVLLLGGEIFPNILQTLKKSVQLKIFNIYGITELSCWAMLGEVSEKDEINLGVLLDDTILEVKDENGKNLIEGEGELLVGSSKRICYLDNEQFGTIKRPLMRKTGDRVLIKNKRLIYKGRLNESIKRFGHRIDLMHIEDLIHVHTGLRNACIWLECLRKLVLFVFINELNGTVAPKVSDKLRVKLLHLLSKECMPDHIELLSSVPLTKNGKIDKKILSCKAEGMFAQVSLPSKHLVSIFSNLWHKYFGHTSLEGLEAKTFDELGGTSIIKIQFTEELRQLYNGPVSPSVLDYIFTNSYKEIHNFLKDVYDYGNKRKINIESNREYKTIKQNNKLLSMQIEWTFDLQACVDCTPVVIENKRLIIVGSFSNMLAILNVDTGEEITKIVLPNAIEGPCLTSNCENFVYVGCYDHNMYCIEIRTGKIMWLYRTGDRIKSKPSYIAEDTILFGSYDKFLHCINTKTGLNIWKLFVDAPVTGDILIVNKRVIVVTIKGTCISLNEFGMEFWQVELDCPIFGSPIVLDDEFVVADVLGTVHIINFDGQKTGLNIWKLFVDAPVTGDILIVNKRVIVVTIKLWNYKVDGNIYSSILLYNNYLIFGTHDSTIFCFERSMDKVEPILKYKLTIDSPTSSTVAILTHDEKEYIVATCITGYVYIINTVDFSIVSSLKLSGDVFSTPVVFKNKVFIGCRDNNLICITIK